MITFEQEKYKKKTKKNWKLKPTVRFLASCELQLHFDEQKDWKVTSLLHHRATGNQIRMFWSHFFVESETFKRRLSWPFAAKISVKKKNTGIKHQHLILKGDSSTFWEIHFIAKSVKTRHFTGAYVTDCCDIFCR